MKKKLLNYIEEHPYPTAVSCGALLVGIGVTGTTGSIWTGLMVLGGIIIVATGIAAEG